MKTPIKTAILMREKPSDWISCQSITKNLMESYQSVLDDILVLSYGPDADDYHIENLAQQIHDENIERLIFIDHQPCPGLLIKELKNRPEVIVHLFGDFMLQLKSWQKIEEGSVRLKLVAASPRQGNLVNTFIGGDFKVYVVPFPLEDSYFASAADEFKRGEHTQFVYAGRLNRQKNILELMEGFINFRKNFNSQAKLKIVGMNDCLGIPYLGKGILPGRFAHQFHQLMNCADDPDCIEYLGPLSRTDLRELFLSSDCFVSMSTYNDEDYGMAVVEALGSGMKCLLSDWGGFAGFQNHFPEGVELVDIDKESLKPNLTSLCKKLLKVESISLKSFNSRESVKVTQEKASVTAVGQQLNELLTEEAKSFPGWNEKIHEVVGQFTVNPGAPFSDADGDYSFLYREIYQTYLEDR